MMKSKNVYLQILCGVLATLLACGCSLSQCLAQETQRHYLSGRDKDHTVDWKFKCTSGSKADEWSTLPVPSQWELHGFGTLNYKKDVGEAVDEHGLYEYRFAAESDWRGQRVFLVFEGVMTDATVKLNGKQAGSTHQGGYYRFSYEVTGLLRWDGENLLEVDVAKHSANESVNKAERTADFWVFGGIYRPVYLKIVPQEFIERVAINAEADGTFAADLFVRTRGEKGEPLHVEAQVQTLEGEDVGNPFQAEYKPTKSLEPTRIAGKLDSPRQWNAETPNLYQVEFRLKQGKKLLHRHRERFGFRTIEVRQGDGIYVNGQRVVLKGVNRHSTWPESGRCLSKEVHRLDIESMKAMNMNAVRMSHYPPDVEFLDLCDELGLYVLDELAGWHWHYDTDVGRKLVGEMVTRDVNHPSILFWNNGNEGGFNVALDEVFGWFDPQQRAVLHPWEGYKGINTAHYLEYERAVVASQGPPTRHGFGKAYQEWEDLNDPNKYIYMPTEMLHGLYDGGSGAGLADYWKLMRESPLLGGGFLWNLFDEGIRRPDGTIDCAGNQAPDGILGPYRQREGSFYTIQELWSPIQLHRETKSKVTIQNDYSFTDASDCRLTWQLRKFPRPQAKSAEHEVVAEGRQPLPAIPPGDSGSLELRLPQDSQQADALAVRIDDPNGIELWTWVWPWREMPPASFVSPEASGEVSVREQTDAIVVEAGKLSLQIGKHDGLLSRVTHDGKGFSLADGPIATTGESNLESLTHSVAGENATITAKYSGPLRAVTWTIHSNGWVDCQYEYAADGALEYYGVTFNYPEEKVQAKRWLGDGPFRVWKNRRAGVTLGIWQNEYNDTITGYSGWEYPEFKGCFANVHWLQLLTTEGSITVVSHQREGFVQVLTPSQPPLEMRGKTSYTLPECGIALLDAVPPVGSKFKPADSTGPMGQLNAASGLYGGRVSFWFDQVGTSD